MNEPVRHSSLHARFVLGLGAVLLPFVIAAAFGVFYVLPALIAPLESIIGDVAEEMEPVRHVQIALLTAAVAANELPARGPGSRAEIEEAGRHVEAAFGKVRASPSFDPQERALIESAWTEWREGRTQLRAEGGAPDARGAGVTRVAYHAERAAAVLDKVYAPARRELERSRAAARVAKTTSLWVTFAAFALALGISLFASGRLAGSVVADIEGLRQGAMRLAKGELSYRVVPGQAVELNDLGTAFNAMAERIEKDQAALADLATHDGLTGLLNRREFLRLLREELDRSRRYAHSCALLFLDVDRFKTVNDTWGHPAGDAVLRSIAGRLLNEVRPTDRVARYGGEEFAVLLPESGAQAGVSLAERIRAAIAATPIAIDSDRAVSVTASIGVTAYPEGGADEEALVLAADRALYSAKDGGRDRVAAFAGRAAS